MSESLEQQRAAAAWQFSRSGVDKAPESYPRLAKAVPTMIMASGLMQTLAFLKEKGAPQHQSLLEHLLAWLSERFDGEATGDASSPFPKRGSTDYAPLMEALFRATPQQYQRANSEALALLRWIRHLAATL